MKKERYFTSQNLDQQALEIYQRVAELAQKKGVPYQPLQSALLVLDMQRYFLSPESHAFVPSSEAIQGGIIQLIDEYFSHRRPIIFTQHINTAQDAGKMATWWRDVLTIANPLHRLTPVIDVAKGRLVQKCQYDAFYQTRLDDMLREDGITQVIICGVMTHLCCESTARSAFMYGYDVFFPVDGTATYNLELHRASLINLAHGFASVVFMKDIHQAMRGVHEG